METLAACGYNGFKLLDQSTVRHLTDPTTWSSFSSWIIGPLRRRNTRRVAIP
jgi:hypothetical protein